MIREASRMRVASPSRRCVMKKLGACLMLAAALMAASSTAALASNVLKVKPKTVNLGPTPVGTVTGGSVTLTNTGSTTINLTVNATKDWDDFSWGFLEGCPIIFEPAPLAPGESCVLSVTFHPSETFLGLKQDERFVATATDPLTGEVLDSDTFLFIGRAS
jgi:HYDIN/CFA65/VesB-like, Ig-like domain